MKKFWVNLLVVLLFAALAMTCASAEADEEIILGDGLEVEVQVEAADDGIVLEDDLSMDAPELPVLGENDGIALDLTLEDVEAVTVSADNEVESNDGAEDFEIINGILVKYNGPGGDVVIPSSVTVIGEKAFDDCSSLTGITIPDSVTSIGDSAFRRCDSLTSVIIPSSVTTIGDEAFWICSSLTSVTIPNSVTSIGEMAFSRCYSLTSVTMPNSITSIGYLTFSSCSSLTRVTIPSSVTCIGVSAFSNCSSLTSVTIPSTVTSIGGYAFSGCSSLTSISIGSGLTHIDIGMFSGCQLLESIILPANISSIDGEAFKNCYSLLDVTLLNGTMDIEDKAFSGCPTTMTFHTPCESKATKWAEEKGYTVIKSDHTPVTDKAVAPSINKTGLTEGSHCSVCGKVLVKQKKVAKLVSIKKCAITGIKDTVYTGKAIQPAPVVTYKGRDLVEGADYTVKYAKNKAVGTATVTVTGIGKYGESVSKAFRINPKAVALTGVTAGTQQLTVKWKKGTSITGYEVQYSLKKDFAGAKKITIKKAATVETVLKKLPTGKICYVRVRAYKTVKGKKYYSAWSKAKGAKVK